jgi:four helix bundle protein
MNKFDLEERLIKFAVLIIRIIETMPNTKAGVHLGGQLLRSGTSPALNYGEAQSAESRNDFVHKIKIVLKELRETLVCLKIISRTKLFANEE